MITDGQLPLRQCLHPEVVAKEIQLPSYYWKFSDLKKEFSQFKSLSGATTPPFNDPSKLQNPQQPSQQSQLSLADMVNGEYFSKEVPTAIAETTIIAMINIAKKRKHAMKHVMPFASST